MRRSIALAITAVSLGGVLLSGLPAQAATRHTSDANYDAPAFLDIHDLEVRNTKKELVVRALIPGFDPASLDATDAGDGDHFSSLGLYIDVRGADGTAWKPRWGEGAGKFLVEVGPAGVAQPIDTILLSRKRGDSYYDGDTAHCAGMRAHVRAGAIRATIPQSCFRRVHGPNAGAVTVKAIMTGDVGPQSRDDRTYTTPRIRKG